jgi:hypothetical protein
MKIRHFVFSVIALLTLFSGITLGAERKNMKDVKYAALLKELQGGDMSKDMTLVMWMPAEFWEAAIRSQPNMPEEQIELFMAGMKKHFIVGVVRGDIGAAGDFRFLTKEQIAGSMTITVIDKDGNKKEIKPVNEEDLDETTSTVLDVMKPMLQKLLGNMGKSFYFYVYSDVGENKKRVASPYEGGQLLVKFAAVGRFKAGGYAFERPLNALFEPRICEGCKFEGLMSWNFCPKCGKKLPE